MGGTIVIENIGFPDPRLADDHGLIAIGGDYRPDVLITAYAHGIFPWPTEDFTHAWFSPNPRMVLEPERLHVSRSLRKALRQGRFRVTFDNAFKQVMRHCATVPRTGQGGTWITEDLMTGFAQLHEMGLAHSVEAWRGDRLVGGVYGLALGSVFCGESMFQRERDASKVAFVSLVKRLRRWDFRMIDCQIHNDHLERLGAREWHRDRFLDALDLAVREPTRRGSWREEEKPPGTP